MLPGAGEFELRTRRTQADLRALGAPTALPRSRPLKSVERIGTSLSPAKETANSEHLMLTFGHLKNA
jgi:hypothetical protein